MKTAQNIIEEDLHYICSNLKEEFSCLSGKRVLITGGAGFLGYYLVQAIWHWNETAGKAQSVQLTVCDNYFRGIPAWLARLEEDKHVTLIKHDVGTPLPQNIGDFQYILHAASIASPTYYRMYPIETMDANVNGLRALLEYCLQQMQKSSPVEGLLFFSSSEIYGDPGPEGIPTPESYRGYVSCTGPRACYDESKRYGETLCVNFACHYNLPIRIVRPFNNYGPGLSIMDRRVLADFARDVLSGRDIVMFSDGLARRTFCYVADGIIGYYNTLVRGRNGEAYNIGVEAPEISIAELANKVAHLARELVGYTGTVVCQASTDENYLVDNPNRRCPMIAKARTELGYNPTISLDEGLRRSLIWYRDSYRSEEVQ